MTLRIGLLGASGIAPTAILDPCRSLDGVETVAIAARDPGRARAFATTHGIRHVSESYNALLGREDVDLVYVALPLPLHERWAIAALDAGKHVLLEKPAAATSASARRMVASARRAGRRVIEGLHYRYHPLFQRVREIAQEIGPLRDIQTSIDVPIPKTPGEIRWDPAMLGSSLMDLGCYPAHWLRTLGGAFDVTSAHFVISGGVDEAVDATLQFTSGARATLRCSMRPHDRLRLTTLHATGERGELFARGLVMPQVGHELRWRFASETHWRRESAPMTASYFHQLSAVADAMMSNTPLPTEGNDLILNAAALEAIFKAGGHERFDNAPS